METGEELARALELIGQRNTFLGGDPLPGTERGSHPQVAGVKKPAGAILSLEKPIGSRYGGHCVLRLCRRQGRSRCHDQRFADLELEARGVQPFRRRHGHLVCLSRQTDQEESLGTVEEEL
jgi:hypothetical protein